MLVTELLSPNRWEGCWHFLSNYVTLSRYETYACTFVHSWKRKLPDCLNTFNDQKITEISSMDRQIYFCFFNLFV